MTNDLAHVEISKENIAYNFTNIKSLLRKKVRLMAVVKSNAYGHGLVEFAQEAVKNGADYLGVVNIDEAIALREARIIKPILVLGYVPIERVVEAAKNYIDIAVVDQEYAVNLIKLKFSTKLRVHLKVETGINRLGIKRANILSVYKELSKSKKIDIIGLYSHLASVEENNLDYTANQFQEFGEIIKLLKINNIEIPLKHIAASGAALLFPESHFDMVRMGIICYGLWPSGENKASFLENADVDLPKPFIKPVLSYKTKIAQIKEVSSGFIGYGCTYRITKEMRLAIIPIGYYEGLDRGLSCSTTSKKVTKTERTGCGNVIISGAICPIVGRICMNMTIIDISKLNPRTVHVGDEVVIIGKQGNKEISAEEMAQKIDTINYEVVARIPEHIPRIYV